MTDIRATFALITIGLAVAGCQTDRKALTLSQGEAINVAIKRAQFEFNCPAATGSVISSEMLAPMINIPLLRGPLRAQYTIGVAGCNHHQTYIVVCPQDGSMTCFAGEGKH